MTHVVSAARDPSWRFSLTGLVRADDKQPALEGGIACDLLTIGKGRGGGGVSGLVGAAGGPEPTGSGWRYARSCLLIRPSPLNPLTTPLAGCPAAGGAASPGRIFLGGLCASPVRPSQPYEGAGGSLPPLPSLTSAPRQWTRRPLGSPEGRGGGRALGSRLGEKDARGGVSVTPRLLHKPRVFFSFAPPIVLRFLPGILLSI